MPVIPEVTQRNQNPLKPQVFVGGKWFFLLCTQQTATNLSSTLRLLFYASSDHVAVLLPTYFYTYRQVTSTNFGFSEGQRKTSSVQMSQSVTSTGQSRSRGCSRTTAEFPMLGTFFITNSNGLQWLKAPFFLGAVAWKQSPRNSGIKVNYQEWLSKNQSKWRAKSRKNGTLLWHWSLVR